MVNEVNAQEWLDKKYPTADKKKGVKRIGCKQDLTGITGLENNFNNSLKLFMEGRSLSAILDNVINKGIIEDGISLKGPLSLKGFVNLEVLSISSHKITTLDISDCLQLRELNCFNNQLTNINISNNRQIEEVNFSGNKLTNLDFTGLDKIEKIFCNECQLKSLEFLKTINPSKLITLRLTHNEFPARDLSCFTPFINLRRLYLEGNRFYGSLKPLRNLTSLCGIGIADTDIDSGLEYLPEIFFDINIAASDLGLTGSYFSRTLLCTGKLAEQLKNYKIENDPLKNYDWQAWKRDNQKLINKAKEQAKQEELIEIAEWEILARETKELYEKIRCDIYQKIHYS
ncbi:uncharacterized protein OCT59_026536 [Rhizophagus irregularis]|uniref:Leucine-rich repeat domain-containing protein n=2 Tax=Rhizophagus irregularis TaxID=588596 RepID=A0A015JR26_RHIIW|nr:hypothetical protein GLOIN_2v1801475 [Rhizophagus irregularis DAOM 181602=DAOM 197198]EXX71992.1 hypothetical protein RirG_073570 [Rhizophagus irregularis DAOM 197198w]UZO06205.1 hypothetical protein OCT59_026536 [Rhizophagus irregularis]POG80459.1 hypothetical protein GLOIN_2v1801475 [Rhizophagus irregularis DAOM 181602=DAOM 197198]CAG8590932.1 19067_t:CDS:1 [Rhizophagus irregularis]GBC16737.1 T9SS type A sorting domain-containing protein [Rhizophagus irregularis DAOM 181602=DAOM 197198]|eukprot:XP_025187325.1 hypothetical protein GLOIN_2v1801475 [Rhizophagus irregularis DAOM 181602=DAOM 197198]